MRWEKVQLRNPQTPVAQPLVSSEISSSGPGKRWGHTCNAIKGGRFLYVFGGYGKDNCQTNQVHVFDTGTFFYFPRFLFFFFFFSFPLSTFVVSACSKSLHFGLCFV